MKGAVQHRNAARLGRHVRGARATITAAVLAVLALLAFFALAAGAEAADAATASDTVAAPAGAPLQQWAFTVLLDGKPIGTHRFTVASRGDEREVSSNARFDVKVLFVTAYRYNHQASERWRGGCLASLAARTEAGGTTSVVSAGDAPDDASSKAPREAAVGKASVAGAAGLTVNGPQGAQRLPGCVSTYAYWDPALPQRTHLLNPQTGKLDAVKFEPAVAGTLDVRGTATAARRVRLTSAEPPIDLWYLPSGAWVGLDSTVAGGRKLSYRLAAVPES